jgi:hypothetical protein
MRIRWKNSGEDSENLRSYIAEGMNVLPADFCGSQCVHFEALRLLLQSFLFQSREIYVETSGSESDRAIPKSGRS